VLRSPLANPRHDRWERRRLEQVAPFRQPHLSHLEFSPSGSPILLQTSVLQARNRS